MKKIILLALLAVLAVSTRAQDTTTVKIIRKNIVTVNEKTGQTEVSLLNDQINIQDKYHSDTTIIRIGRKSVEIIEGDGRTYVNVFRKDSLTRSQWRNTRKPFNGHWAGFELGVNGLYGTDYSLYQLTNYVMPEGVPDEFMELKQAASLEVNINVLEFNVALKEHRIGLVSGLGFQWNNYKFDNPVGIDKTSAGIIEPFPIEEHNFKKSKLMVSYLTLPLMLEFQFPVNGNRNTMYLSGGMIGALNLGSHTKIKNDSSKDKDRGSFNINPFKYSAVGRIGFGDFSLYATYSFSSLFKDDKGPEMYPFSIGIALVNF
ncbi:MAG: outer membrane beta-barrel protein [Mangrovibacterium sp.]